MKLLDLLNVKNIIKPLKENIKKDVIKEMAESLVLTGNLNSLEQYMEDVFKREELSPTALGFNMALPHARSKGVDKPGIAIGFSAEGISDWNDEEPVYMVFMIAVPESGGNMHMDILAKLSRMLIHDDFRQALMESATAEDVMENMKKMFEKQD